MVGSSNQISPASFSGIKTILSITLLFPLSFFTAVSFIGLETSGGRLPANCKSLSSVAWSIVIGIPFVFTPSLIAALLTLDVNVTPENIHEHFHEKT